MITVSMEFIDAKGRLVRLEEDRCGSAGVVEAYKSLDEAAANLEAIGLESVGDATPQREITGTGELPTPQPNGKPAGEWVDDPEQMKNFQKLLEYRNVDLNSGLKLTGSPSWRSYASSELALKAVDAKLDTKEGADEALDVDDVPESLGGYLKKSHDKEEEPAVPPNGDKSDLKDRYMALHQKATAADIPRSKWNDLPQGYTEKDLDKAEETLDCLIAQGVIASELRASLKRFVEGLKEGVLPVGRDVIELDDGRHMLYREGTGPVKQEAPLLVRIKGETEPEHNSTAAYLNDSRKVRLADPLIGVVNSFMGQAYSKEATEEAEKDFFEYADIYQLDGQPNTLLEAARKEGPMTRDRWLALQDKLHELSADKEEATA